MIILYCTWILVHFLSPIQYMMRSTSWQLFASSEKVDSAWFLQLPRTKECAKWNQPTFSEWSMFTTSPRAPLSMTSRILVQGGKYLERHT